MRGRGIALLDAMPKTTANTEITLTATFTDGAGTPTDPTSVKFRYRIGARATDREVATTKTGTGEYSVTFTPEWDGPLYGVFTGTGTLVKTIPVYKPIYPEQTPIG